MAASISVSRQNVCTSEGCLSNSALSAACGTVATVLCPTLIRSWSMDRQIQRHQVGDVARNVQRQDLATISDDLLAIQKAAHQRNAIERPVAFSQDAFSIAQRPDRMRKRVERGAFLLRQADNRLQAGNQSLMHWKVTWLRC